MRVLVTGLSGFTGWHLASELKSAGYEIFGLGSEPSSVVAQYLCANLDETDRIGTWLREVRPTHVIHLAALSHVVGDAIDFYRVNVLGTESLLQAIADAGILPQKIVIASSANIYGNAQKSPITEATAIRPANHYGVSKAAMELMLCKWQQHLPIIISRPFNYTGPGQSDRFVYAKIVAAFRQRSKVVRLGNIHVSRDLSDVRYVANIYRLLLECEHHNIVVNICSGNAISILQAIDIMVDIAGYRPAIDIDPSLVRPDEIMTLSGDPSYLRQLLGDVTPIKIERTLQDMYELSA
jgi:nucleoside-diphosphate-sugar epimerase